MKTVETKNVEGNYIVTQNPDGSTTTLIINDNGTKTTKITQPDGSTTTIVLPYQAPILDEERIKQIEAEAKRAAQNKE